MFTKLLRNLTYSNVVATLALFLALGGGAYAAVKLPSNSVSTKQIKTGAVRASDLGKGAVTLSKIKANSVDSSKVIANSLTGDDVNEGALGAVPAATALARIDYESATAPVPAGATSASVTANCPQGMVVTGGGGRVSNPTKGGLNHSFPAARGGWTVEAFNTDTAASTVTAFAICAQAASTTP